MLDYCNLLFFLLVSYLCFLQSDSFPKSSLSKYTTSHPSLKPSVASHCLQMRSRVLSMNSIQPLFPARCSTPRYCSCSRARLCSFFPSCFACAGLSAWYVPPSFLRNSKNPNSFPLRSAPPLCFWHYSGVSGPFSLFQEHLGHTCIIASVTLFQHSFPSLVNEKVHIISDYFFF